MARPQPLDQADSAPGSAGAVRGSAPRWLRILLPTLVITAWFVGAAVGGPYFGRVEEVSSNDQTSYLPDSADATRVQRLLGEFDASGAIPAIIVFASNSALTEGQLTAIADGLARIPGTPGVGEEISPAIPSEDGRAVQAFVPIQADADIPDVVRGVSDLLKESAPDDVSVYVTGPAGFTADLIAALAASTASSSWSLSSPSSSS